MRVYVSGDNLFTITDYRGYNPEVSYKSSNMMPGSTGDVIRFRAFIR